jgi:beta-1,2-mannobiose phosphorylase / 1,2-beta-oligomannan phosphorylase
MKNGMSILLVLVAIATLCPGVAYGQTVWVKDARNPIITGGAPGSWNRNVAGPCVLYNTETETYQMWFTAWASASTPVYRIGYATSQDGAAWLIYASPVLAPGPLITDWDRGMVAWQKVIRENGIYKMWYLGGVGSTSFPWSIGYAESIDGIEWDKYDGNPVMLPGTDAWEAGGPYGVSIMPYEGEYKMWYAGLDQSLSLARVGYATSPDGINWKRDTVNNPVLDIGEPGQWDRGTVYPAEVLLCGGYYYMWYLGGIAVNQPTRGGFAYSPDGVNDWRRDPHNPVLSPTPGAWDGASVEPGTVMLRNGEFVMWYDGGNNVNPVKIGLATSTDITAVVPEAQTEPQAFVVQQNYPNPFNPRTTLSFTLPATGQVQVAIYDAKGQIVARLIDDTLAAGTHTVDWDGGDAYGASMPSGTYFCRLTSPWGVETRKMGLIR